MGGKGVDTRDARTEIQGDFLRPNLGGIMEVAMLGFDLAWI